MAFRDLITGLSPFVGCSSRPPLDIRPTSTARRRETGFARAWSLRYVLKAVLPAPARDTITGRVSRRDNRGHHWAEPLRRTGRYLLCPDEHLQRRPAVSSSSACSGCLRSLSRGPRQISAPWERFAPALKRMSAPEHAWDYETAIRPLNVPLRYIRTKRLLELCWRLLSFVRIWSGSTAITGGSLSPTRCSRGRPRLIAIPGTDRACAILALMGKTHRGIDRAFFRRRQTQPEFRGSPRQILPLPAFAGRDWARR